MAYDSCVMKDAKGRKEEISSWFREISLVETGKKRKKKKRAERKKKGKRKKRKRKRKDVGGFFLSSSAFQQSEFVEPKSKVCLCDKGSSPRGRDSSYSGLFSILRVVW